MQKSRTLSLLCGLALAGSSAATTRASLTLNLQFADGSTTHTITAADVGTTIPINLYGTIKTGVPVTPTNTGAGGNHDGLQYVYTDVLSSLTAGSTAVDGQLSSISLTSTFHAVDGGSQAGVLQDANGDGVTDLGPATTSVYAGTQDQLNQFSKPRSQFATFENNGTSPQTVISADRLSVSFLLETLYFYVNSLSGKQTTFVPVAPSFPGTPYASANWFEDVPVEPSIGYPVGPAYTYAYGDIAGTSVTFFNPNPTPVPEPALGSLIGLTACTVLARRSRPRRPK